MISLIRGDAKEVVATLPSKSAQVVVTSPPYFGLRDYGVSGQIGLERSSEEYLSRLWSLFDQTKAVLKDRGTLWVNIADTWNSYPGASRPGKGSLSARNTGRPSFPSGYGLLDRGFPTKSLLCIPGRFAIGMIARGWTLRSEMIWAKGKQSLPDRASDRLSSTHEILYLFSKGEKYLFSGTGEDVLRFGTSKNGGGHPAPFPEDIPRLAIGCGSNPGDLVLDPFHGSGTTGRVCEELGRDYIGVDLKLDWGKK